MYSLARIFAPKLTISSNRSNLLFWFYFFWNRYILLYYACEYPDIIMSGIWSARRVIRSNNCRRAFWPLHSVAEAYLVCFAKALFLRGANDSGQLVLFGKTLTWLLARLLPPLKLRRPFIRNHKLLHNNTMPTCRHQHTLHLVKRVWRPGGNSSQVCRNLKGLPLRQQNVRSTFLLLPFPFRLKSRFTFLSRVFFFLVILMQIRMAFLVFLYVRVCIMLVSKYRLQMQMENFTYGATFLLLLRNGQFALCSIRLTYYISDLQWIISQRER